MQHLHLRRPAPSLFLFLSWSDCCTVMLRPLPPSFVPIKPLPQRDFVWMYEGLWLRCNGPYVPRFTVDKSKCYWSLSWVQNRNKIRIYWPVISFLVRIFKQLCAKSNNIQLQMDMDTAFPMQPHDVPHKRTYFVLHRLVLAPFLWTFVAMRVLVEPTALHSPHASLLKMSRAPRTRCTNHGEVITDC